MPTFHSCFVSNPLDRLQARYDNLRDLLIQGENKVLVVRKFGHPWILLDPLEPLVHNSENQIYSCHFTESELRTLHRRFGHPSVGRLYKILERAGHDPDSAILKRIAEFCEHCQKHGGPPGRFKFTLKDDIEFNHSVLVDVVDLEGKEVLHVVCEATGFNSGRFLKSRSAKHAWEALRACWIDVYQGPPNFIVHDPGRNQLP
jgi:hypothetical protein